MLNEVDGVFKYSTNFGHLSGCLCLSIEADSTSKGVTKEYGVAGTWTKILRTESVHFCQLHPLCYLNNNETILVRLPKNNLTFWDSGDEEFKNVNIGRVENVYVKNLVSLNHHDFQEVNFLLNKSLVELLIVLSISLSCLPRFVKKQGDLLAN
ncbi:hypothetical protein LWI28_002440 [Acer negundo]|uniref:Uncharacterized protein n=1 Tax=Acer negundo TaxID=4023 RepID=A0AAD5JEP2_ACENE|nr:hypothetical protein LWI28_002440 [Acer negundo]